MLTGVTIRKNQYYDSVFLMGINNRLTNVPGVTQSAVLMGSDANKEVLTELGFKATEILDASANDLVVAVRASSQATIDQIMENLNNWLTEVTRSKTNTEIRTFDQACSIRPDASLVVISVPGEYAAHETRKCLEAGKHVFLFSDNVSLEDEISLKRFASERGLLVMGPDCGTSLIGGVGIGFANAVRRGSIGAIAAAGTGLQEFTCLVHNAGYGISHAIGTGGRDLSDAVGGLTTWTALDALEKDPTTEVIAILSKPPGQGTLEKLAARINECYKPIVCCFLGLKEHLPGARKSFRQARTIDEAVLMAIEAAGGKAGVEDPAAMANKPAVVKGKYLRGVFAGGTFCYQSQQILRDAGIQVHSNAPLEQSLKLASPTKSSDHSIVDMGDEYFMVGRPHPMINGSQRALRILQEARDPDTGILLLDFILGYNSSMDPVGELFEAIQQARQIVRERGTNLVIVASICGTEGDPQDIQMQKKLLEALGAVVFSSNARATEYCVQLLAR